MVKDSKALLFATFLNNTLIYNIKQPYSKTVIALTPSLYQPPKECPLIEHFSEIIYINTLFSIHESAVASMRLTFRNAIVRLKLAAYYGKIPSAIHYCIHKQDIPVYQVTTPYSETLLLQGAQRCICYP
jgi:hypothetical protein